MKLRTLFLAGTATALLAAPVAAQQPVDKQVDKRERKADSPASQTGQRNANQNAGFTTGGTGGQTGGLREGMPVLLNGEQIGTIVKLQGRDGDLSKVTVRFFDGSRVMLKLVPKVMLKVKANQALIDLIREQIEQLENA